MYDLVIRNGFILDGSGAPGFIGDIAITGDTIRAISSAIPEQGAKEIDAGVHHPGCAGQHLLGNPATRRAHQLAELKPLHAPGLVVGG